MTTDNAFFGSVLTDITDGPSLGSHAALTEALLRRFAEKGLPLAQCADRRMMKRSLATLQARARQFGLAFPDYVPLALRKTVTLIQRGDFYDLYGSSAADVAKLFNLTLLGSKDDPMVAFPAHNLDDSKEQLKANWYIVKVVKAKRARKGRAA